MFSHLGDQLAGRRRLSYDIDAGCAERLAVNLAEKRGIVGNDHAHGILIVSLVPRPSALSMSSPPPWAWARSRIRASPVPRGSAPPRPSSVTTASTIGP